MKKQRVGPLSNARKLMCCPGGHYYHNVKCFHCSSDSVDRDNPDSHNNHHNDASKTGKAGGDNNKEDVCLLRESPYRILRVAESGNVKEFQRLITADIGKLNVRDSRGRAAVHQATARNHVSILQVIVAFNGSLDLLDNHLNTPLHLAVEFETLDTLEFLLANSADTKKLNDKFQSPLHLACELNKIKALLILAKYKHLLDPDICGEHGRTPLHIAASNDFDEAVKILLYEIGACPKKCDLFGNFIIHEAAKHASSRSMEILLTWGDHHDCPRSEMISFFDAEGNVPLHSAVHGGDIKAVELCLRSGAKISTQQHDLSTPIHLACSQGAMDMVKLMFALQPEEKEGCLKSCDMQRMTPLHCAAMFDHCDLVEFLITEGASVNVLDKERRSPLIIAASRNGWRTMRVLIRLGANISLKDNDSRNLLHVLVIHGGELNKILDGEICKDINPILEEKDKHGMTPLHYCAKQGHLKSAVKLIKLGGNILTKNNEGDNVFHVACRYGRLNIIQHILNMEQNNSVINEGNGKGQTPLHISAAAGHIRVVQTLMKKGALLHRDHGGSTALHLASKNGQKETMKVILNVHSHLLDQTDKDGCTALHCAAMENRPAAVDLLLTLNCRIVTNLKGCTPIDYALQNKFSAVALVLCTHPTRGDEILALTAGKYSSVMLELVATMPQVATAVLDRCIVKSDQKTDSELYHIKYDFRWLSLVEPSDESEAKAVEKAEKKLLEGKYLPILNGMVSSGRVDLLSHDLSQKYLQSKWNAYGKYVHLTHLVLYLFYLIILTIYTSNSTTIHNCIKYREMHHSAWEDKLITTTTTAATTITTSSDAFFSQNETVTNDTDQATSIFGSGPSSKSCGTDDNLVFELIICFVALFNLSRELSNIYRQRLKYILDTSNWAFWTMNAASLCMISYRLLPLSIVSPSASLVAFLSWFYLLLFLQRFDVVGIYVVMFLEILHTLLRVLLIFSILIVAFGLAFFILLSNGNHVAFEGVSMSLLRTFSMLLGDMDFMNTFVNPFTCDNVSESERSLRKECELKRQLPHPAMSFLMIGIFMVLMPILLMNLLVGLAVGDIESVRRNAQLKRLAMQVHLHTALEKTLPKFILLRVDKKEVIEYPNVSKARLGIVDYMFRCFQPKSPNKGPETIVEEDFGDDVVATMQQNQTTLGTLSSRLENIEVLMRLLCQKMELATDMDYEILDDGATTPGSSTGEETGGWERRKSIVKLSAKIPRRSDSVV